MTDKKFAVKNKKEQFTKKRGSRLPLILILLAAAAAVITGTVLLIGGSGDTRADLPFGNPETGSRSYIGRVVKMTAIEPSVEGDRVVIPLEQLDAHEIVSFEIDNRDGFAVPMMAYITPSGRIFTGSSMCEPCQGRSFFLAGETLVCETCRTTYTIESHEFISGSPACGKYPPVYMPPVVENGMVRIALDDILQWQIRAY